MSLVELDKVMNVRGYVIAFAVLKILQNLISMEKFWLQITAEASKITKGVQCDHTFIFIKLSEAVNSFVKISLVLEIKNVANFIKTRFLLKTKLHKNV